MKWLLLGLIYSLPFVYLYGQKDLDSLKKYTYLGWKIQPITKDSAAIYYSNCFFVNLNNKIYLITAKHCIDSRDSLFKVHWYSVRLYNKQTKRYDKYPIDVSKFSSFYTDDRFKPNFKDFVILPTTITAKYDVNTINKFLFNEELGNAKVQKTVNYSMDSNTEYLLDSGIIEKDINTKLVINGKVDTVNYLYQTINGVFKRGSSGSPVFLILNNGSIIFGGVGTTKGLKTNTIFFVRYKLITDSLNHIKQENH